MLIDDEFSLGILSHYATKIKFHHLTKFVP